MGTAGPHHDDRCGAVPEQAACDEVRERRVVALDREAAEFDREEDGDVVRMAEEVVVDPGDAGGAGDAPETHERHALDVITQADLCGDTRLERRDGEPGDRRGDDEVDVPGTDPCSSQGLGHGMGAELSGDADELIVGLTEIGQLPVALEGQREVPLADTGIGVQALEHLPAGPDRAQHSGERRGDLRLRIGVLRQDALDSR